MDAGVLDEEAVNPHIVIDHINRILGTSGLEIVWLETDRRLVEGDTGLTIEEADIIVDI